MFFGEFEYKVDEKGRVPVPPGFRKELSAGVVLTPGPDGCIAIYPLQAWKKVADSIAASSTPIPRAKLRKLNRAMFGTAFRLIVDGQGRIALPAPLREYAGLQDDVVIVGVDNTLELWDKQAWESEKSDSLEQFGQIIESLEERK
ncbi:MAG: division/cell wall cluster transcriptional repressor MraZ [Chloroflexi bacterium]|nr:division/cell wall cluster transcriptional repressor MraZ [Chloroflexota bacterium]